MFERDGFMDLREIEQLPGFPGWQALSRKACAVLECPEEIPCNPCEAACPRGAIHVGRPITNLPRIDAASCTGCGSCIARCPGLAVFVVDLTLTDHDRVILPYEALPLPRAGDAAECLNRAGEVMARGRIVHAVSGEACDCTTVVTVEVPKGLGMEVRGICPVADKGKSVCTGACRDGGAKSPSLSQDAPASREDFGQALACRCEEVSVQEVIDAIREGATTPDAVKRRTRAGMGLCQGRNCGRTVARLIAREMGRPVSLVPPASKRPPVRPIGLGAVLLDGESNGK